MMAKSLLTKCATYNSPDKRLFTWQGMNLEHVLPKRKMKLFSLPRHQEGVRIWKIYPYHKRNVWFFGGTGMRIHGCSAINVIGRLTIHSTEMMAIQRGVRMKYQYSFLQGAVSVEAQKEKGKDARE